MIEFISWSPNPTKHLDPWAQALDAEVDEEVSEIHTIYTTMGTVVVAITVPITVGIVQMRITLCPLARLSIQLQREIEDVLKAHTCIRRSLTPQ